MGMPREVDKGDIKVISTGTHHKFRVRPGADFMKGLRLSPVSGSKSFV